MAIRTNEVASKGEINSRRANNQFVLAVGLRKIPKPHDAIGRSRCSQPTRVDSKSGVTNGTVVPPQHSNGRQWIVGRQIPQSQARLIARARHPPTIGAESNSTYFTIVAMQDELG